MALLVRDKLAERGLSAAPVTSGSKGLHLYAALPGTLSSDEVRDAGPGDRPRSSPGSTRGWWSGR